MFGPAVGWSFVGSGLYAARHRPESRIGVLMVLLGFAWFVFCLEASDADVVYTFALLTGAVWGSVFLHIGVTFPSGRIESRADRAMVLAGYLVFPLAFLPALLFMADTNPDNLLLVRDDPDLADTLSLAGAPAYLALFVVVLVRGARRWRDSTPFERVQLTPVYVFALSTFLLVTIARGFDSEEAWWAALISTGLMPFAFLGGLMRSEIVSLDASLQESLEELRASRARIVEAGDAERRRLERDLHDGAQSRLVALSLLLQVARKKADGDVADCSTRRRRAAASLAELRELARGIHPAVLTDRGLEPALRTLADRAPVPVEIRAEIRRAAPRVGRERRVLRRLRGADQRGQVLAGHRGPRARGADQRPREGRGLRRRDRRRGRHPRLRPARALRPRGGARRDAVGGEPSGARDPAARRDPGQMIRRRGTS